MLYLTFLIKLQQQFARFLLSGVPKVGTENSLIQLKNIERKSVATKLTLHKNTHGYTISMRCYKCIKSRTAK